MFMKHQTLLLRLSSSTKNSSQQNGTRSWTFFSRFIESLLNFSYSIPQLGERRLRYKNETIIKKNCPWCVLVMKFCNTGHTPPSTFKKLAVSLTDITFTLETVLENEVDFGSPRRRLCFRLCRSWVSWNVTGIYCGPAPISSILPIVDISSQWFHPVICFAKVDRRIWRRCWARRSGCWKLYWSLARRDGLWWWPEQQLEARE